MTSDRHQRIGDIVHAALDLPPGERAALIDRECAGDGDLRAEVESMLRAAHDAGTFLDAPLVGPEVEAILAGSSPALVSEPDAGMQKAGDRVGSLRIERFLGGGGMGEVYLAWQHQPRRRVALKIIRLGMDSQAVVSRLRHEQQALAAMDHPNIAHVFDAGCTPPDKGGRPFFTMEYVEGEPITEYCDRHALTNRQRLDLFIPVCEAVQHAHQKGIIHRDLKPSNVLVAEVEGRPVPKVIDFGIAKAIDQTVLERTVYSLDGQFIGTPEYMSPEQAGGRADVDTRTDVYSLGVMLYELLVGRLPFDSINLRIKGLDEARRIIREVEPPRPSTLLGTLGEAADRVASAHGLDRASMLRELRRELEWVPLKALRKERERRYDSPAALADDIRRYLDGRPLRAAPESRVYLARKFVKRNRGPVAAMLAIITALSGGLTATTWAWAEAARARTSAEYEQYRAGIRGTQSALDANDVASARLQLNQAPVNLRGWEWYHLRASTDDSLRALRADPDTMVQCITLSHNGNRAAVGLSSGVVLVWNWQNSVEPQRLIGHSLGVTSIAFSRDGSHLLTAAFDRTVRAWDVSIGRQLVPAVALAGNPDQAVFSPDESRIIAFCTDGTVQVFDSRDGQLLGQFNGSAKPPRVAFGAVLSPDGSCEVTAWNDGSAEVRSTADGRSIIALDGRGGPGPESFATFSPDGGKVAQAWDHHLRVCNAETGRELAVMSGHGGQISSTAFSPDGSRLASSSLDGTARVWSTVDGRQICMMIGHDGAVTRALFSPDGGLILTASHDATLRLWNADTGQELAKLHGHESELVNMTMSDDGAWALTSGLDQSVRVWDIRGMTAATALPVQADNATAASFSPDGERVVISSAGGPDNTGAVSIWSVRSGQRLHDLEGPTGQVWSAVFSPDGTRIVTASEDGSSRIWDAATGHELRELRHTGWVNWAMFSPDGTRVVTASEDHAARIWDAASGQMIHHLDHAKKVRCAAYSRDGSRIATACDDGLIHLWDAATGQPIRTLAGHTGPVICVCYSRDGRWLASSSEDETARLWDADTGRCAQELSGHTKRVMSVCFSPDASRVVTASWDQSVRVWDTASGREMAAFRDHRRDVNWAVFSPDGTRLLTTYRDGAVLIRDSVSRSDRFAELEASLRK